MWINYITPNKVERKPEPKKHHQTTQENLDIIYKRRQKPEPKKFVDSYGMEIKNGDYVEGIIKCRNEAGWVWEDRYVGQAIIDGDTVMVKTKDAIGYIEEFDIVRKV